MAISDDAFVLILTGPFGSGCTTIAGILNERAGFTHSTLSDQLKEAWLKDYPNEVPQRRDLQRLGNALRSASGAEILVRTAVKTLNGDKTEHKAIVFDAARNPAEIEWLRQRFAGRCYAIALECQTSHRWKRLEPSYLRANLVFEHFIADDRRDRDEEVDWGQRVQLCVDRSDAIILNDNSITQTALHENVLNCVNLLKGTKPRYAIPREILMNLAYSAAHASKCLKRQVGAVLVAAEPNKMGEVIGLGYNENPPPTAPCVEEPAYGANPASGVPGKCYRDEVRHNSFVRFGGLGVQCPQCRRPIDDKEAEPPWKCSACNAALEDYFWPERAMTWCTAVHAEVAALFAAGHRAKGSTLYTTTFPCFQCAEKLIQAGVTNIVFTEPYPDIMAATRLDLAKVGVHRFEGIRSSRFDEIFGRARRLIAPNK